MRPEDFDLISGILKTRSGLILSPEKVYLLESRLTPIARAKGLETLDDLINEIRLHRKEALLSEITEAMTTNESFFFRDNTPFDLFKDKVLPELIKRNAQTKKIKIWCAAASTGQEPYSIAMIVKEMGAKLEGWDIEIFGTDLSNKVLEKAKVGLYSQFEVQRGMPIKYLMKHFAQVGEMWQISEELKGMVKFKPMNLLDNYMGFHNYDVVFCRNVLIYFEPDMKTKVLEKVRKAMKPDGTLFLGAAETVLGITDKFKPVTGSRGMYHTTDVSDALSSSLRTG